MLKGRQPTNTGQGATRFTGGLNPGDTPKMKMAFRRREAKVFKERIEGLEDTEPTREDVRDAKLNLGGNPYRDYLCFEILDETSHTRFLPMQELLDELMTTRITLPKGTKLTPLILEAVRDMKAEQSKFNMARVLIRQAASVQNNGISIILLSEANRLNDNVDKTGPILVRLSHHLLQGGHYKRTTDVVQSALRDHGSNLSDGERETAMLIYAHCLYESDPEKCVDYLEAHAELPNGHRANLLAKATRAAQLAKPWDGLVTKDTVFLIDMTELLPLCCNMNHWTPHKNVQKLVEALQEFCTSKSVSVTLLHSSGSHDFIIDSEASPNVSVMSLETINIKSFPKNSVMVGTDDRLLYMARTLQVPSVKPTNFLFGTVSESVLPDGCENVAAVHTEQGHFPTQMPTAASTKYGFSNTRNPADYKKIKIEKFQRHMGITNRALEMTKNYTSKLSFAHRQFGIPMPGVLQTNIKNP